MNFQKKHVGLWGWVIGVGLCASAYPYGMDVTHPHITREAITLIEEKSKETTEPPGQQPEFEEILRHRNLIIAGARDEDVPSTNGAYHFYSPRTGEGLELFGTENESALERAELKWTRAIAWYHQGLKEFAYTEMGKIAHLTTQDMAQPAHVHNDPHLPHLVGGDASTYEDYGELNSTRYAGSEIIERETVAQYANAVANTAYEMALCQQRSDPSNPAHYLLRCGTKDHEMVFVQSINLHHPNPACKLPHYEVRGISGPLCFAPSRDEDEGLFINDFWDVSIANRLYYFDRTDQITMDEAGTTQNEYFLSRLIPIAINNTAGLIKLFAKEVDPIKPSVSVRDGNNEDVLPRGTLYIPNAQLHIIDSTDTAHPTASGVYSVRIQGETANGTAYSNTFLFNGVSDRAIGAHNQIFDMGPLENGEYTLVAFDGLGNISDPYSFTVFIDTTPPTQQLFTTAAEAITHHGAVYTNQIRMESQDVGSGLHQSFLLNLETGNRFGVRDYAGSVEPQTDFYDALPDGSYEMFSYDVAGNVSVFPFTICTEGPCGPCLPGMLRNAEGQCVLEFVHCRCALNILECGRQEAELACTFSGDPGDSCRVELLDFNITNGGPAPVINRAFGGRFTSTGTFNVWFADASAGTSRIVDSVFYPGPTCRPDPTFIGGQPVQPQLPTPQNPDADAFSPGVQELGTAVFNHSYTVPFLAAEVTAFIERAQGQVIATLKTQAFESQGSHSITWNGRNAEGTLQSEGEYRWALHIRDRNDASRRALTTGLIWIDNTPPRAELFTLQVRPGDRHIHVHGRATDAHFREYRIDRATSSAGPFIMIGSNSQPVSEGVLGSFDTSEWGIGEHLLRLTVTDKAGLVSTALMNMRVDPVASASRHVAIGDIDATSFLGNTTSGPVDNPASWLNDALPPGGKTDGSVTSIDWQFVSTPVYSGGISHTDSFADDAPGMRLHYYIHQKPGRVIAPDENIIQYVFIDPAFPPTQLLLGFYTGQGDTEHRVFWGDDEIQTDAVPGTLGSMRLGNLPPSGQWIRLKVPARLIGLEGKTLRGMLYGAYGGRAYWDKTTASLNTLDAQFPVARGVHEESSLATTVQIPYTVNFPTRLRVDIVSVANEQVVNTLFEGFRSSGTFVASWNKTDFQGLTVPEGNYLVKFTSPDGAIDSEDLVLLGTTTATGPFANSINDFHGNRYRIDASTPQVIKETSSGYTVLRVGSGFLTQPSGLALSPTGDILVQDVSGVWKFGIAAKAFNSGPVYAKINIPWNRALVRATVPIIGEAAGDSFANFRVEIGSSWNPSSWKLLNQSVSPIQGSFTLTPGQLAIYGNLATWETGIVGGDEFPPDDPAHPPIDLGIHGRWTVRLTVTGRDGSTAVDEKRVMVGRVIDNGMGGVIRSDDGKALIRVPPLSLAADWDIFGFVTATTTAPGFMPPPPTHLVAASAVYELLPGSYSFLNNTTMEIAVSTAFVPNKLALYRYNNITGKWDVISRQYVMVHDSSGTWIGGKLQDTRFKATPQVAGFYGVYADLDVPEPPLLYPISSPTRQRSVRVTGRSEPFADLNVFATSSDPSISVQEIVQADTAGLFDARLLLSSGTYRITAIAVDRFGNQSASSNALEISVSFQNPAVISALQFKTSDFIQSVTSGLEPNSRIYLEMSASDIDPTEHDEVFVILSSSITDSEGLLIPLRQTTPTSSLYQGAARLGRWTLVQNLELGARMESEWIIAVAESSPSMRTALPLASSQSPHAPHVFSPTHPSAVQDTFENGVGEWRSFNDQRGASIALTSMTASTGHYALQLSQGEPHGNFSAVLRESPFEVTQFPIVSWDYCAPAGQSFPPISIYFRWNGILHQVRATPDSPEMHRGRGFGQGFAVLNVPPLDLIADGRWHTTQLNLLTLLKNLYPSVDRFVVDQVIMGYWEPGEYYSVKAGEVLGGTILWIDNFTIRSVGHAIPDALFRWSNASPGANRYSYQLDRSSNTVPDTIAEGSQASASFKGLARGEWTFHVRTQNAQGVWGLTNHFRMAFDDVPPVLSQPDPPSAVPLVRSHQLTTTVHVDDAQGIDLSTLRFTVNQASYTAASGGVHFDAKKGLLRIAIPALVPPPPGIEDGGRVIVSITHLADLAGNFIAQPFTWSWMRDVTTVAGGNLIQVTQSGGMNPAWSADANRLLFASDRFGQSDLFVLEPTTGSFVEGAGQLTRMTSTPAQETEPVFSPNGAYIAFVSDAAGTKDIWLMPNTVSAQAMPLTSGPQQDTHPVFSSDGSRIYFSRAGTEEANLWMIRLDPATGVVLETRALTQRDLGKNLSPTILTENGALAYQESLYRDAIILADSEARDPKILTTSGNDIAPSFSPDGKTLVFSSRRESDAYALWTMDIEGGNSRRLLDNQNQWSDTEAVWSPDGRRIAFTSLRSGSPNIWVLSLSSVSNFAATPPVFSPAASPGVRDSTSIHYELSTPSASVTLEILDKDGRVVSTLLRQDAQSTGSHSSVWSGQDASHALVPEGVYKAKLTINSPATSEPLVEQISITVDNTAPLMSLEADSGDSTLGYFNPRTIFSINANDDQGIDSVELAVDTASDYRVYQGTFTLGIGSHTISLRATDGAGNTSDRTVAIWIDGHVPTSTATWRGPAVQSSSDTLVVSVQTTYIFSSVDNSSANNSGIAALIVSTGGVSQSTTAASMVFGPLTEGEKEHVFLFHAKDKAGNEESPQAFRVFLDLTAPDVELVTIPPLTVSEGRYLATAETEFSLTAHDPLSGGSAAGVQDVLLSTSSEMPRPYQGSFKLPEGATVQFLYYAIDRVGNSSFMKTLEVSVMRSTTPVPDLTPPITTLLISSGPFISTSTVFSFTARDPVEKGVASGVNRTFVSKDGDAFAVFIGSFVFTSSGTHTLQWYSDDVAGNVEVTQSTSIVVQGITAPVQSDTLPPLTQIRFTATPYQSADGVLFIKSSTRVGFTAEDFGTPASGVALIRYALDGASFKTFTSSLSVSEGMHTIQYHSQDRTGNQEVTQSTSIAVDNTPPDSSLVIGAPKLRVIFDIVIISSFTPLSISAIDPSVRGASSGVKDHWISIDGEPFKPIQGNFFIPARRDSIHTIRYYSRDALLNTETPEIAIIFVVTSARIPTNPSGIWLPLSFWREYRAAGYLAGPADALSLDAFELRETFVFPNPARGGARPTFHIETGLADDIQLMIYDVAGRLVHEALITQSPNLIDAGKGPQYAYEYVWGGAIPSGIYFYTVEARKSGADPIRAKGKFAVVR